MPPAAGVADERFAHPLRRGPSRLFAEDDDDDLTQLDDLAGLDDHQESLPHRGAPRAPPRRFPDMHFRSSRPNGMRPDVPEHPPPGARRPVGLGVRVVSEPILSPARRFPAVTGAASARRQGPQPQRARHRGGRRRVRRRVWPTKEPPHKDLIRQKSAGFPCGCRRSLRRPPAVPQRERGSTRRRRHPPSTSPRLPMPEALAAVGDARRKLRGLAPPSRLHEASRALRSDALDARTATDGSRTSRRP